MAHGERLGNQGLAWISLGIAAVAITVFGVVGFLSSSNSESWEEAGQRGDFTSGFFGTGVSLAGMLLFFTALILQTDELRQQREEIEANRVEMRESRRVAETQLRLAEETAVVTQVLACTRLVFEAERRRAEGKTEKETFVPSDQLARIKELVNILLYQHNTDERLMEALRTLTDARTERWSEE